MAKPGRPSPGLDDYLYWQERLASREASNLSIDEFCADEDISRSTFYRWVQRLKDGIPDVVKEEGASLTLADIAVSDRLVYGDLGARISPLDAVAGHRRGPVVLGANDARPAGGQARFGKHHHRRCGPADHRRLRQPPEKAET